MSLKILALDTSTSACSVALSVDSEIITTSKIAPRQHNELLLKMLESVLAEAGLSLSQLDGLAFGCGPGSFTGLRIAAGVIQAIAFAHDLPVVLISTLRTLAQCAYRETQIQYILPAIDAVMGEVYWGCYHLNAENIMLPLQAEIICKPQEVQAAKEHNWVGIGDGWDLYSKEMAEKLGIENISKILLQHFPLAHDMIPLAKYDYAQGKAVTAEKALPVYLRDELYKKK